jgi:hypothetical protein
LKESRKAIAGLRESACIGVGVTVMVSFLLIAVCNFFVDLHANKPAKKKEQSIILKMR